MENKMDYTGLTIQNAYQMLMSIANEYSLLALEKGMSINVSKEVVTSFGSNVGEVREHVFVTVAKNNKTVYSSLITAAMDEYRTFVGAVIAIHDFEIFFKNLENETNA